MNNGIGTYFQYGFTDPKDIVAAEQFAADNNLSREAAISVLQMNKEIAGGNFKDLHEPDKDKWRVDMKKKFMKEGNDEATAQANVETAEGYLIALNSKKAKIQ